MPNSGDDDDRIMIEDGKTGGSENAIGGVLNDGCSFSFSLFDEGLDVFGQIFAAKAAAGLVEHLRLPREQGEIAAVANDECVVLVGFEVLDHFIESARAEARGDDACETPIGVFVGGGENHGHFLGVMSRGKASDDEGLGGFFFCFDEKIAVGDVGRGDVRSIGRDGLPMMSLPWWS